MFFVVYQVSRRVRMMIQRNKQAVSTAIGLKSKHFDPGQQDLFLMKEHYHEI